MSKNSITIMKNKAFRGTKLTTQYTSSALTKYLIKMKHFKIVFPILINYSSGELIFKEYERKLINPDDNTIRPFVGPNQDFCLTFPGNSKPGKIWMEKCANAKNEPTNPAQKFKLVNYWDSPIQPANEAGLSEWYNDACIGFSNVEQDFILDKCDAFPKKSTIFFYSDGLVCTEKVNRPRDTGDPRICFGFKSDTDNRSNKLPIEPVPFGLTFSDIGHVTSSGIDLDGTDEGIGFLGRFQPLFATSSLARFMSARCWGLDTENNENKHLDLAMCTSGRGDSEVARLDYGFKYDESLSQIIWLKDPTFCVAVDYSKLFNEILMDSKGRTAKGIPYYKLTLKKCGADLESMSPAIKYANKNLYYEDSGSQAPMLIRTHTTIGTGKLGYGFPYVLVDEESSIDTVSFGYYDRTFLDTSMTTTTESYYDDDYIPW